MKGTAQDNRLQPSPPFIAEPMWQEAFELYKSLASGNDLQQKKLEWNQFSAYLSGEVSVSDYYGDALLREPIEKVAQIIGAEVTQDNFPHHTAFRKYLCQALCQHVQAQGDAYSEQLAATAECRMYLHPLQLINQRLVRYYVNDSQRRNNFQVDHFVDMPELQTAAEAAIDRVAFSTIHTSFTTVASRAIRNAIIDIADKKASTRRRAMPMEHLGEADFAVNPTSAVGGDEPGLAANISTLSLLLSPTERTVLDIFVRNFNDEGDKMVRQKDMAASIEMNPLTFNRHLMNIRRKLRVFAAHAHAVEAQIDQVLEPKSISRERF